MTSTQFLPPRITRQPEDKWRAIPDFPEYEMNLIEEVRHIAARRMAGARTQDGINIRLWKGGMLHVQPVRTLAIKTWPEYYDQKEDSRGIDESHPDYSGEQRWSHNLV